MDTPALDGAVKKQWITLVFPEDLTKRQESLLIANLQAVRDGTRDELKKVSAKLQRQRFEYLMGVPIMREAIQFMRGRAAMLARGAADEFFTLGKENGHTYYFGYAYEELKAINAQVKILGKTLNLPEPSLINENSLVAGLKKHVFPDMGIPADRVIVTVSDTEPPAKC
jgi:hypothetical protein